jgi:hypothetical protein
MRVYISGKIGEEVISDATRQKFARAEEMLKAKGYEVFNPTCEEWQVHLKKRYDVDRQTYQPYTDGTLPDFYGYCLLRDLMALSIKDAIYMLPDWKKSPGATTEYWYAVAAGRSIYFENEKDAREHARRWFWEHANDFINDHRPFDIVLNEFENEAVKKIWLPIE